MRVDLGDGLDTLVHEGSAGDDRFDASAIGDRVRLTRGWGREPIDLDNVDTLRIAALAGEDRVSVDDLQATDTFQVDVDLGVGDGDVDRTEVNGSNGDDSISVNRFGSLVSVLGPTFVQFVGEEPADRLTVNGRRGDDDLSANTDAMKMTLDGGDGGGTLRGGPGDDVLIGGDGFDDAVGRGGSDTARLDGNFDRFSWAPGDGSDEVDGGASRDSLFFQGENGAEAFDLTPRGRKVRLTRDLGSIVMDLEKIEEIDTLAGRGEDSFAIGDLTGTPVELVDVSLSPGFGFPGGDGQADRVAVAGTDRDDHLTLTGRVVVGGTATLTGLPWKVNVSHTEGALDTLAINTGAGDDTIDTAGFAPETIGLDVD